MMQDTLNVNLNQAPFWWDAVKQLIPVVSMLLMGMVAWFLKKLNTGQDSAAAQAGVAAEKADMAGMAASVAAKKADSVGVAAASAASAAQHAATSAAALVEAVSVNATKQGDQITALVVQGGKIHDLVNSNLTAYKQVVVDLAASDASLRKQLRDAGMIPEAAQVKDIRIDTPQGGDSPAGGGTK